MLFRQLSGLTKFKLTSKAPNVSIDVFKLFEVKLTFCRKYCPDQVAGWMDESVGYKAILSIYMSMSVVEIELDLANFET